MQASISEKLVSYLLWLQERGQIWLPAIQERPGCVDSESESTGLPGTDHSDDKGEASPDPEMSPPPEISSPPHRETTGGQGPQRSLVRLAGCSGARVLVLIDCIGSGRLVSGVERQVLVRMLQGLGLDIKKDVILCGIDTGSSCEALGLPEEYKKSLEDVLVGRGEGLCVAMSLGSLVPGYLLGDTAPFADSPDSWGVLSLSERQQIPFLRCWHPMDYLRDPELKKNSWHQMKKIFNYLC